MDKEFEKYKNDAQGKHTFLGDYGITRVPGGIMLARDVWENGVIVAGTDTYIFFPPTLSQKLSRL